MRWRCASRSALMFIGLMVILGGPCAADDARKELPPAVREGGKPLMQALAERKTTREFADTPLSAQVLSDLLWATWGVNRADGRHTAPTARNQQKMLVYTALPDGIWRYDPSKHVLIREKTEDMRARLGGGAAVLIYAAPEDAWSSMHVGALFQNAGLFCASAGLGNVVRASGIKAMEGVLTLPEGYAVRMTQAVGWPR